MKKLGMIIITILILFALWSFEAWEVNPVNWTTASRGYFSIVIGGIILIIIKAPKDILE